TPARTALARETNSPEADGPLPGRLGNRRPGSQHERRRFEGPSAPPIPVIEHADGSLWTYENVPILTLFHEMASLARLKVVVIASERTQQPKAAPFRHAPRR